MHLKHNFLFWASMVVTRSRVGQRMAASALVSSSGPKKNVGRKRAKTSSKTAKTESTKRKKAKPQNLKVAADISSANKSNPASRKPTNSRSTLLMSLPDDIVSGVLRHRPSKRNRSPYVGDLFLEEEDREAIVHVPNLDMGGKCVPGATLLVKPARDKKGNKVGPHAVNPKYGTPKCEFIAQLLHVDESELGYTPAWVGAHPSLGEKIAESLVGKNLLGPNFPQVESFQREVRNVGGADMRADFVVQHKDSSLPPRIVEVKTVVDTDYSIDAVPNREKCVFTSSVKPYKRTAIFPWGQSNQKGPNGEKVVSARAIKHVRELTRLANTSSDTGKAAYDATVLFVVIRGDAKAFRPNYEACPSFTKYLKEAEAKGVQILAKQVVWGEGDDIGKCFEGPLLDIDWPETE